MLKNLVKEALKIQFFKDKDLIINDYLKSTNKEEEVLTYTYTSGKVVLVDTDSGVAYSRNGFFFSVILKDFDYIDGLDEKVLLDSLDDHYFSKYGEPVDDEEDEEEE